MKISGGSTASNQRRSQSPGLNDGLGFRAVGFRVLRGLGFRVLRGLGFRVLRGLGFRVLRGLGFRV